MRKVFLVLMVCAVSSSGFAKSSREYIQDIWKTSQEFFDFKRDHLALIYRMYDVRTGDHLTNTYCYQKAAGKVMCGWVRVKKGDAPVVSPAAWPVTMDAM